MRTKIFLIVLFSLLIRQLFSQVVLIENFDNGIPATWTVNDLGSSNDTWFGTSGGLGGDYLDNTEFAFVDSDAAGNTGVIMIEELISPVFDGTPYTAGLLVSFDHYFRTINSTDYGAFLVFDGTNWDTLETFTVDEGGWAAPVNKEYNVTSYINTNMQFKFVYEDDGEWAWYWAVDNFKVFVAPDHDLAVTDLTIESGCGKTNSYVDVTIKNAGTMMESNVDFEVILTGDITSVTTGTFTGTIAPSQYQTFSIGPIDMSNGGDIHITAVNKLASDQNFLNDSLTISRTLTPFPNPQSILTTGCLGMPAFAEAVSPLPSEENYWLDGTGNLLGVGNSLPLGVLSSDTTVYLNTRGIANKTTGLEDWSGGPMVNAPNGGSVFNVHEEIILDSVFTYVSDYALPNLYVVVNLENSNGIILMSDTTFVIPNSNLKQVLELNFVIPPGNGYVLNGLGSNITYFAMEITNPGFPFVTNELTLTGPVLGGPGTYYNFYDWHYSTKACSGDTIPVTVSFLDVDATVTDIVTGNDGAIDLTVVGGQPPYSFVWDSGQLTEDISGLSAGTYCVSVSDNTGSCIVDLCETVMSTSSLTTIDGLQSIELSPNPAAELVTLKVAFDRPIELMLEITNSLGQSMYSMSFDRQAELQHAIDLSSFAGGLYFVTLKSNKQFITKRLIVVSK